jgi:predicted ferric reductase
MFETDNNTDNNNDAFWMFAGIAILTILLLMMVAVVVLVPGSPVLAWFAKVIDALFAVSSVQFLWYVTRAAGISAYLLLWLSTAWGLAVSSKIFDPVLHRFFTYDMHQFLSLLAIGFATLHVAVLLSDRYLPFSLAQILVPFAAPYRPVWVGLGVIGMYLTLLVSITFYIRQWIGYRTFRIIHYVSFITYIGVALHGLLSGTDSPLLSIELMYAGTFLVIVFLFAYRMVIAVLHPITTREQIH